VDSRIAKPNESLLTKPDAVNPAMKPQLTIKSQVQSDRLRLRDPT
jgi:hypothetical protein